MKVTILYLISFPFPCFWGGRNRQRFIPYDSQGPNRKLEITYEFVSLLFTTLLFCIIALALVGKYFCHWVRFVNVMSIPYLT